MKIRINLLPHREIKRTARRRQFNVMLAAAAGLGVVIVFLGQTVIGSRQESQQARNVFLESEIAKLDAQIVKIKEIRSQTESLLDRKQVVEELQSNRTEVVHLFDDMIRLLPEGLYLKSVKQSGDMVQLSGYTQSSARVSSLMRSLDASPWLEQSTLVEIKAAKLNGQQVNEFSLTVRQTKQNPTNDEVAKS
jgi:type IV pilus assembly protein PilN